MSAEFTTVFARRSTKASSPKEGGVIVESMRSPIAKDAYHSFNKWRSGRSVYSETFNVDGSVAATLTFNL